MRVCFVVPEIFHWGKHGGFGRLTRTIGRELAKRDVEVFVVTPREEKGGQKAIEKLDGMTVLGYPKFKNTPSRTIRAVFRRMKAIQFFELADADVYHSESATIDSYVALKAMPNRKHMVTFQDPYDFEAFRKMSLVDPSYRLGFGGKLRYRLTNHIIKRYCKKADGIYSQAKYLGSKVKKMYDLERDIGWLPNPIEICDRRVEKDKEPTVCFLARWDAQKRPEIFFNLAKQFPEVNFIAMGKAHDEKRDSRLRNKYSHIPNLRLTGFVSQKEKEEILDRSWIMINTSVREALPVAFLEALVHKTAILSSENPDGIAKNFGFHVTKGDFVKGLKWLLNEERWKSRGERGYRYVKKFHEKEKVIDLHLKTYRQILE
ncbi:hypothetical protein AKJ65_06140 [candidate division MSBL1 archaeon SCGC-AAA259E19]|uniref:Glycosyl transferase family 1 domain-containing protein n=1 Tax=candidate division MSBL1 archaeon SCGC-AAA259E19 TaxID=1698264 RepID=A0A133UHG2_9EURY|nr:hypothetical protein AKJ65_06140 [candidate division MSBL1 archaeon SCGC-AAA259E19]